uniref:centrosomal protein of 295 kDa isoform X3 n=1 Tax=Jaculus jaculus TaxID=51337 RepID=UPI001E1B395E|nr:centrosomal protein of 295 kDa isoform X3 [Jaculus jaculus]
MKRKVVNAGKLRLSPNEEALILKEDYERRRKLRLLQVREQERGIASQRREDTKHRRNRQLTRLAEELREEWEEAQTQKIQNLEKLYLASLRSMGAGHQQAKENEPDLDALAWRAAERKRKAEMRHKEALKVQRNQKEMLMKQKTWHIKARKDALLVEKERSAKVTSLPPPVPAAFENIEVKRISSLKTNSSTYHHLSSFVTRQMDTEQPDAHLAAKEAAKRLEELQKQAAQEREEQFERAHVRGTKAMKKIQLAQNQEKLMKELKQLQQEDLARRRQTVAQMPPQLVELPYKRSEIKEDWQRELEFAFEDMYNADRKVKGNLILHLEPEPLPAVSDQIQDEELDISMEQENEDEARNLPVTDADKGSSEADVVPFAMKNQQLPSKVLFKRLLNKIRNQKSLWTIKSMSEDDSETAATISEAESQVPAVDLGEAHSEEGALSSEQEQVMGSDILTIESGPLSSEDKQLPCQAYSGKEQAVNETPPVTAVAQSSVLLHPQEEAARIRMSARHKQIMEIEEQKQKQLELLEQIEQQKLRLETDCFRAQLEEEKREKTQQTEVAPASCDIISDEHSHRQMIRNYQQQLLQQNRLHRQSVETARKRLLEYQTILKRRYPSMSATSLVSDSVISVPPWKSEKLTTSEHRDQSQRLKLSPNKYPPMKPIQIPRGEQGNIQEPRQYHFSQKQAETAETLNTLDVLAKQRLESQDHLRQFQLETQQRDYKLIPKDSHILSRALSFDRPQTLQDARKMPETFRVTTFQSLDSQQILSVNSENLFSKPNELSSFLPLVPEHSFTCLPVKGESGKTQEPFSNISKSAVSINQTVLSQVHGQPVVSSETITAQQGNLKALQEQLELQKEILQARQEAQEQLLLCKQQKLEEQNGLSTLLPVAAGESFVSLPPVKGGPRRIQESPARNITAASLGDVDEFRGVPEPILLQQNNLKFLQEQSNMQRDNLQARREAQEVLFTCKESELDGRIGAEQTGPHQVVLHPFTSLPFADHKSRNIQEQHLPKSEKGLLSSQSEIPRSQDGSSSFLQQFLPLRDSLKLLQHQLTSQEDTLQARHNAQVELLLQRQKDLGGSMSGPVSSSFSSLVSQKSVSLHTAMEAESRFQKLYSSEKENIIPSGHLIIPTLQDTSLLSPQHSPPKEENLAVLQEQLDMQEVTPDAGEETREFIHKQSEQTSTSSSPFQVDESERFQEFMSIKSDSTGPSSHSKIPRFRERLLRFSQHILPLQDNLGQQQEWLDTEREVIQVSQQTQENISSKQTGFSLTPQLGQPSYMSLPSVGSGTRQELSTESDSKITSSHLQIPELQDRLLKISQLIQPQQDNLKALQEQLATQREVITQTRWEAHEEALSQKRKGWRGKTSPEQVGVSSPSAAEHSFPSSPLPESEKKTFSSTTSDNTISSRHSEMLVLPDSALDLPHTDLPQQGNLSALQEHLHAQTNPFPCTEKIQKEFLLSRQCKLEEDVSSRHFIPPHLGYLKALQQQLDIQRKSIRSGQEIQEELLLQRLTKLEQRVLSEQSSSIPFSSQVANSEGTQKSLPAKSGDPGILRAQGRILTFSQPLLPQHDHLTLQLDLGREEVFPREKSQELLLNKQKMKSESDEHVLSSLCLSKEIEHSFIPLPFAEAKPKNICELGPSKNAHTALSSDSVIPRLQDRCLRFSQPVLTQQENVSLQKQLDLQREVLHSSQKAQEELLKQRQTALQQQIQKHQETLKDFFNGSKASKPTDESDFKMQMIDQLREWLPHIPDLARSDEESIGLADRNSSDGNQLLSEDVSVEHGEHLDKALGTKVSKPPVAKVICGLDLNQHELSTIQEVESPASGKTSTPGKPDFCQDRDPLRVSVSREQNFLVSPLARDPFGSCEPSVEAVKVKEAAAENHAVLSYAVSEEDDRCLGPTLEPDNKEISHERSPSVTISTGSFLSHENTDLSLTEPGSFSELDHQELESTTSKHKGTNNLCSVVPLAQILYEQNSSDVHKSLLSHEAYTPDHIHCQIIDKYRDEANLIPEKTDLWELEHIFPNLHRQLFKPLEPRLDFNLSPSSSGISQDNRDFHQRSESSFGKHLCNVSPASSFTALRTDLHSFNNMRLNPQPDTNLAHADQSFATQNTEESEQSFKQLLPEASSQESQHDLPSIYSIEARHSPQDMENFSYSSKELAEILSNKKSVHFQSSIENLDSVCRTSDAVFDQLHVEHSTPYGSSSGQCLMKLQSKPKLGSQEHLETEAVTMLQDTDSQLCVRTIEMGTSEQAPHSLSVEDKLYESGTETSKGLRNISSQAQAEVFPRSESLSLQSSIPVWETESGHGIMEEPELTLVSISDISIAETDFANLALEESENEAKSCLQASALESSDYPVVSEQPAALPESLQEAFAKRKKSFMERSYQRQREIQSKARASKNTQVKTGSFQSHRGKVSLPEERKTAQSALRLHNQLLEVKQQKEQKARQEAYAQNRARAKEFHKKTLAKLRARNIC